MDDRKTVAESAPTGALAAPAPAGELHAGQHLGGYEVIRLLGRGGMGAVYLAKHLKLDRLVVVKVIAPELASQPEVVGRLQREARAAAKISSDHVVLVHDCDTLDGVPFIVMEFVEGTSVADHLEKSFRLSAAEATRILLGAARGLKAAHDVGVLHRDVKPANLLLAKDGRVKVADFGLAKLAAPSSDLGVQKSATLSLEGQILGTPAYMAPEQADAQPLDARADIYALGVTYYQLLTGELPFKGSSALKVIAAALHDPVRPPRELIPSIPEAVENVCLSLMARERAARPASMDAVIALLEGLSAPAVAPSMVSGIAAPLAAKTPPPAPAARPVAPPPVAPPPVARPSSPRVAVAARSAPPRGDSLDRTLLAVCGVAVVTFLGVGAALALRPRHVPAPPPRPAATSSAPASSDTDGPVPPIFTDDPERNREDAKRDAEMRAIEKASIEHRREEDQRWKDEADQRAADARQKARDRAEREGALRAKEQQLQADAQRIEDERFQHRSDDLARREAELHQRESDLQSKETDLRVRVATDSKLERQLQQTRRDLDSVRAQLESVAREKLRLVRDQEDALKRRK